MFASRAFRAANATHLLVGGALIIGMVTIPLMANTVLAKSALDGGLMLMRMTVAIPLSARRSAVWRVSAWMSAYRRPSGWRS